MCMMYGYALKKYLRAPFSDFRTELQTRTTKGHLVGTNDSYLSMVHNAILSLLEASGLFVKVKVYSTRVYRKYK